MITSIAFENLKCFQSLRLDLAPLTLLTGYNAAGKSTSLQSLLLLAQSIRSQRGIKELRLNGPLVSLGTPADVLNNRSGAKSLAISVGSEEREIRLQFRLHEENRRRMGLAEMEVRGDSIKKFTPSELRDFDPLQPDESSRDILRNLENLVFLGAARQVETEVFPVPLDLTIRSGDVGVIGQFAPWWLYNDGDNQVDLARRCPTDQKAVTLGKQINAWCGQLFPGAEVNAVPISRTNLMQLELRSGPTEEWTSPVNIGYGVSYAFPILVSGLCATNSQPVVLDSPEAHLHPRGQSQIGRFLAQMAAAGSQILVETHSDHLLNGVRLALRDGTIRPDEVAIYFFSPAAKSHVKRLSVDAHGSINDWPEGFFDQSERDLSTLAGWTAD